MNCLIPVMLCMLQPTAVDIEYDHTSHISQHFGPDRTNYGFNFEGLAVRWRFGPINVTVAEGAIVDRCLDGYCGALRGPRETTQVRLTYTLWRRD